MVESGRVAGMGRLSGNQSSMRLIRYGPVDEKELSLDKYCFRTVDGIEIDPLRINRAELKEMGFKEYSRGDPDLGVFQGLERGGIEVGFIDESVFLVDALWTSTEGDAPQIGRRGEPTSYSLRLSNEDVVGLLGIEDFYEEADRIGTGFYW